MPRRASSFSSVLVLAFAAAACSPVNQPSVVSLDPNAPVVVPNKVAGDGEVRFTVRPRYTTGSAVAIELDIRAGTLQIIGPLSGAIFYSAAPGREPVGSGMPQPFQVVRVQLEESLYRGEVVELQWGGRRALDPNGFLRVGDRVLLSVTRDGNARTYAILEIVRLPALIPVAAILVLALLVVARLKGLAALAGLASSVAVFLLAVVPALRGGSDPLVATIFGCLGVIAVSVFVVHGLNRKSLAALCGTMAGLGVVTAMGAFALATARMTGLGSEEQIFLAVGTDGRIDMARLALAAVMVGSLIAIMAASLGLVLCVPITTAIAVMFAGSPPPRAQE